MADFHFYAITDEEKVAAFGTANSPTTDRMLEACGFKWNRRRQRYIGTPARLAGMNRLIDAGFIPAYSTGRDLGLWREGMGQHELLAYGEALKLVPQPKRCTRTLEMFA